MTLFCNCLPQPTVLRVWDLILLEGNEVLLRTALAIWQNLAERIMTVRSADEFYGLMGALTQELLEFELIDANTLIKSVVTIGPLTELKSLREHYLYNINPWGATVPSLFPSSIDKQMKLYTKDRLVLDINALKKQYVKLKQRQRQARIIFNAAISRQPAPSAPVAMNHLLLGKSALVSAKRLGPPKGSIPPVRVPPSTLHWKDAPAIKTTSDSSSSSDTELCDEPSASSSDEDENKKMPEDNLMIKDNKCEEKVQSDIFDNTASTSVNLFQESDDDSGDFEKFLQDRVRCLEIKTPEEEDSSACRIQFARRNSERALQIIQENSLILHRIMQCQSRLSPPFVESNNINDNTIEIDHTAASFCDTISSSVSKHPLELDTNTVFIEENQSPEYGSRYTKIIEKSRDLDEKFNNLIANASVNLKTFDLDPSATTDSYRIPTKPENSYRISSQVPDLSLDTLKLNEETSWSKSPTSTSLKSSPTSLEFSDKSPKSPNKVFNPFPVSVSSRQNKEVPLKLGLYKK